MTKKFRTMKASIVMGVLLVSIFAAFIPTSSAGLFINLSSYVSIDLGNESLEKPIVPRSEPGQLTIYVTYGVNKGGMLSQLLFALYEGRQVNIKLQITEKSDWCTATLPADTITTSTSAGAETERTTTLTVRVDENAPAYGAGYVKIEASVPRIGPIEGFSQIFTIEFTPAYLPIISAVPQGNSKTIGPMDTAVFPIVVENMGNARTTVKFTIENVPEGWIAVVDDEITLDEAQGSTGTAYLTIKPPKGFGYHNDPTSITVTLTPFRTQNPSQIGPPKEVTVMVESRGFSTPGFEPILFIGALLMIVLLLKWKKKK